MYGTYGMYNMMNSLWHGMFLIWILCGFYLGIIPAMIANSKGRNPILWYIYGIVFFLIALTHSLIIRKTRKKLVSDMKADGYFECPICKQFISDGATICPCCHREIEWEDNSQSSDSIDNSNDNTNKSL